MAKGQIKQKQSKIDQRQFEELCSIQCTQEEILSVLSISDKTLNSWCNSTYGKNFSEIFKEKRQGGRSSLRRSQWNLAKKNASMAIFLGKQYLGQKDVIENKITNNGIIEELTEALKNVKETERDTESETD